jgi:D-amino-acid dehydrogenase
MNIMNDIVPFEQYKRTAQGSLQLFFSKQSQDLMRQRMDIIKCDKRILSKEECLEMEPNLAADRSFIGGIYSPDDSSGDIHLFTKAVHEKCLSNGVEFRFNTKIESFVQEEGSVVYCVTQTGERIYADDVVICAGNGSPALGDMVGDKICSYPIQGYALEIPTLSLLRFNVMDDISKLYSSPLAGSIRISGITRLNHPHPQDKISYDKSLADKLVEKVRPFFREHFMADESQMKIHTCFRPQTPDDLPIIGIGALRNVWYNCGHGHLGFTRGAGSAHLLCSLLMGQPPAVPVEPFSPLR